MSRRTSFVVKRRDTGKMKKIHPLIELSPQRKIHNLSKAEKEEDNDEDYECELCKYNMHCHSFVLIKKTNGVIYYHTIISDIMIHKEHEIDEYLNHLCGTLLHSKTPWIWLMDFTGFSTINMIRNKILIRLLDLIHDIYCVNMQQIIILQHSWHVRLGYTLLKKNIAEHIQRKITFDRKNIFNQMVSILLQTKNNFN
jgi:hypothetical protein